MRGLPDTIVRHPAGYAVAFTVDSQYHFTGPYNHKADGTYDGKDTGVNNAGALKGAEMLSRLVKEGVMPKGSTYADMEAGMAQGKLAMMISGPWAWENVAKAKINYGVALIPSVGGKKAAGYACALVQIISHIPGIIAPIFMGYIVQVTGHYTAGVITAGLVGILGACLFPLLYRGEKDHYQEPVTACPLEP